MAARPSQSGGPRMIDDDEDLIGVPVPAKAAPKKKGRPKGSKTRKLMKPANPPSEPPVTSTYYRAEAAVLQALLNPVTITFLSQVMEMDRQTVTKRLAKLPPVVMHRGGTPAYNFKQAMSYLATPVIDPAEVIKRIGSNDLPSALQKDVWDARLKAQKWRRQAGELWATEDVLEVLGEAFKRLKTTTQLWVDQITDKLALSDEMREELSRAVDGLQHDLHQTLVEMPKDRATKSQLAEIEGTELDG